MVSVRNNIFHAPMRRPSGIGRVATGTKNNLLPVQAGEIVVVNTDKNFQRIHGRTIEVVKQLKKLIGNPEEVSGNINIEHGILFTKRKRGRNNVGWTYKENDFVAVANLLNRNYDMGILERVKPEDVAISANDKNFQRIHGKSEKLVCQMKELLGDPEQVSEVINDRHGILFTKKRRGPGKVWTVEEEYLPAVARLLEKKYDLEILENINSEEIAVTNTDIEFQRIHGTTSEVVNKIKDLIGDPEKVPEVINSEYGIIFSRRRKGSRKVWAFKHEDLSAVAELLRLKYSIIKLEKVNVGEVIISNYDNNLKRIHGSTSKLVQKLKNILGDPDGVSEDTRDERGIIFTKRISGMNKVWTFKETDLFAVARLLGRSCDSEILEVIKPDEVAISPNDKNFQRIRGREGELVKQIKQLIGDPEKVAEVINYKCGIIFTRRRKGVRKVWAFKKENLPAVAKLLGRKLKHEGARKNGDFIGVEHLHLQELLRQKENRNRDETDKEYEYELELVK
ncbi:hypothetical protein ACFL52_04680 [Candidatus Margulisiibacteriota bacterium]